LTRRELLAAAANLGLLPHVVEKDYVLGWLLAGIFNYSALADTWVFKGGTCLKKLPRNGRRARIRRNAP
jgi:predicted nucleotidyltransferase component of viral defense system